MQNIAGPEQRKLLEQAVTVPSPATNAIGEAARHAGVVVSIGVNERDGGTLYNTQLLFDADGTLIQRRRKISPTYHERMIWGQGDGSGLRAVDSKVGRIGQLACWEHYNHLARYAMMADGEQIHSAMYPGSIFGELFAQQTEINVRQHALESGCFVVTATAWLDADQQAQLMKDTGCSIGPISGGCFTAIVAPDGTLLGEPIRPGHGMSERNDNHRGPGPEMQRRLVQAFRGDRQKAHGDHRPPGHEGVPQRAWRGCERCGT